MRLAWRGWRRAAVVLHLAGQLLNVFGGELFEQVGADAGDQVGMDRGPVARSGILAHVRGRRLSLRAVVT